MMCYSLEDSTMEELRDFERLWRKTPGCSEFWDECMLALAARLDRFLKIGKVSSMKSLIAGLRRGRRRRRGG